MEAGTGRYSSDKRIASFVGFLPLKDPELLILVVIDEPKGEVYGGIVAAPAFNQIAVKTAYYLGISPTEQDGNEMTERIREETGPAGVRMARVATGSGGGALVMPDLRGLSMGRVVDLMERYSVRVQLSGSGVANAQSPSPGAILVPGTEVKVAFRAEQGER